MITYAVIINIFFAISYFYSSGIQGSVLLSFATTYFLIISVAQKRHYWIWTVSNLLLVVSLVVYEYHYPEAVQYAYQDRQTRFVDITSTYVVTIVLTFLCLSYIINNYSTEKRMAEENFRKLEQMNEEKNKLLSIVSHDFNSPLSNIQTYLSILERTDLKPEERKEFEKELRRITNDTQEFLHNLLLWTKGQMEGFDFSVSAIEVRSSLQETLEVCKNNADSKSINLEYDLMKDVFIKANRDLFQLVVRNLVNNAVKFTPEGGKIIISSEILSDDNFLLKITDNGRGISSDKQADVFTSRIKSTFGTNKEKGTGLGLRICKEFTEAQKGEIWFESCENQGTTFFLKMPLAYHFS